MLYDTVGKISRQHHETCTHVYELARGTHAGHLKYAFGPANIPRLLSLAHSTQLSKPRPLSIIPNSSHAKVWVEIKHPCERPLTLFACVNKSQQTEHLTSIAWRPRRGYPSRHQRVIQPPSPPSLSSSRAKSTSATKIDIIYVGAARGETPEPPNRNTEPFFFLADARTLCQ